MATDTLTLPVTRVLWAGGIGVVLVIATQLAYGIAIDLVPGLTGEVDDLYRALDARPGPLLAAPLVVAIVVAEEVIWRGVALSWLQAKYPLGLAVGIAVVLYSLPQLASGSWILVAAALVLGTVFSVQRVLFRGLLEPVLTHSIWSVSMFCVFPLG